VQAGTDDFLSKPVNKLELLKRVQMMLRCKDLTDENERLRRYIQEMEEGGPPGGADQPKNSGEDDKPKEEGGPPAGDGGKPKKPPPKKS
jgi:DNA-binding response OmpR family regulator